MKNWQQHLIAGFVILIIGFGFLLYAMSINIPSVYKTFLGIPYQVNPEYFVAFLQFIALYSFGLLFIGAGIGYLGSTYSVYKLEKKLESTVIPPPPP